MLKRFGVSEIIGLAVNDGAVMDCWSKAHQADGVLTFFGDPNCEFTKACGFQVDLGWAVGGPARCLRYSLTMKKGCVNKLNLEPMDGILKPAISLADAMVEQLQGSQENGTGV